MATAGIEVRLFAALRPVDWEHLRRQRGRRSVNWGWIWAVGPGVGIGRAHVAQASASRCLGRFGFTLWRPRFGLM